MGTLKEKLQLLYSDASKHSTYQSIPDFVSIELGYTEQINENWRCDRPRLEHLVANRLPSPGETWLDFGANTGFFSLSLAHEFPNTEFIAVEANANHSKFIEIISEHFGISNLRVLNQAIGLHQIELLPLSDFMLHLNVLHHAGHDFDKDLVATKDKFLGYAESYLSALRSATRSMLFQMGSNWGGDKSQPIVDAFDDTRKLTEFTSLLTASGWECEQISFPRKGSDGIIRYEDVSHHLATEEDSFNFLNDFPGEFHRRPMFVCSQTQPPD